MSNISNNANTSYFISHSLSPRFFRPRSICRITTPLTRWQTILMTIPSWIWPMPWHVRSFWRSPLLSQQLCQRDKRHSTHSTRRSHGITIILVTIIITITNLHKSKTIRVASSCISRTSTTLLKSTISSSCTYRARISRRRGRPCFKSSSHATKSSQRFATSFVSTSSAWWITSTSSRASSWPSW